MTVETLPEMAPGSYDILVELTIASTRRFTRKWILHVNAPGPQPTPSFPVDSTGATGGTGATGPTEPVVGDISTGPTGQTGTAEGIAFEDETVEAIPFEQNAPQEFIGPPRSRFVLAVNGPGEVSTDPALILTNGILALLLTLVILAPGTLFESTLEANLLEVKGWFGWTRTPTGGAKGILRRLSRSRLGLALIATLTALLYGFLSSDFGADEASIALVLGIFGAILLITLVKETTIGYYVRRDTLKKAYLRVFPGALLVGIACVAISRLAGFEPGYLWALVAVVAFRGTLGNVQGKALAIASGALLVLSVGTWVALTPIRDALSDPNPSFGLLVLEALLVATFVAALEGLFFGLMPLRFLDGQKIIDWNRWVWFGLFALTLFAFLHLLLNPASGYFGWSSETPAMLVIGLFAGFSLFSVAFWAYFRFRRSA